MKRYLLLTLIFFWILCGSSRAEVPRGMFGLPSLKASDPSGYLSLLRSAHVNAVFVPGDEETIRFFRSHGFATYISVNAFGGKEAWKKYPDSRPVKADGHLLGSEEGYKGYGGVCPSHTPWRKERMARIGDLVKRLEGIGGIWLDFIRYPGLWEVPDPKIPDTCYCRRCLQQFREETRSALPEEIDAKGASLWIRENAPYDWMMWKKRQIASFVREIRGMLERTGMPIKLGLFLVPWTKGERENAISYQMAQDAFDLSGMVDVISPMVYHRMCGRPETWVGYMTRYYKETASCQVWPIVQSIDCRPEEFSRVLQSAGEADADGILVYSFKGMRPDKGMRPELWRGLGAFQRPKNLIPNPDFQIPEGEHLPTGWDTGRTSEGKVQKSTFQVKPSHSFSIKEDPSILEEGSHCIGITAGNDRAGMWSIRLPHGEPGTEYLFTARLYREQWKNGVYPSISIWGEEFIVNTHWLTRRFQPIRLYVTCPEKVQDPTFRFINHNPGETLWLTRPRLAKNHEFKWPVNKEADPPVFFNRDFFPIGVYGADTGRLEEIKGLGLNSVFIGGHGEGLQKALAKCHDLGLRYVLSTPHDPDRLPPFLKGLAGDIRPHDVAFYVNDEPGIHSFPINRAGDINRLIKDRFPEAATCMAVVRPQVCRNYLDASDFFMMDQYPVPYMPMTWLSDSMEDAARATGANRLASVIQAFGGERWEGAGWPRLPTWQEMDCLAFLSVIHGSRAIFFFTFSEIGKTEEGRKSLGRVVERLNRVYPWLVEKNLDHRLKVDMVSPHRFDPRGRPAVHACLKRKGNQGLIICTNAIGTYTEAVIPLKGAGMGGMRECQDVFSGMGYPVMDGGIRARFGPFETKVFLVRQEP